LIVSIDGNAFSVQYKQHFDSQPTIVLLHPLASSIELEDRLEFPDWRLCGVSHSLLRFDFPGHGRSHCQHNYQKLTWLALAEGLCKLLRELSVDKVVLVGSSMGAGVSLHAASIVRGFDIDLQGLVLIVPPTSGKARQRLAVIYKDWASIIRRSGCAELVRLWRMAPATAFFEREFPEAREISFNDFIARDPMSMAAAFEAAAVSDLPGIDQLNSIKCPVRILARTDDPIHPISAAEEIASIIDGAQLSIASRGDDLRAWPQAVTSLIDSLQTNRSLAY
jgi:pimeloyl-ACP methyl ester carboxylesterase